MDIAQGVIAYTTAFKFSGTGARMFKVYNSSGKVVSKATVAAETTSPEFEVRFKPKSAGEKTGTLTIRSNDPNRPSLEITLNGTGK